MLLSDEHFFCMIGRLHEALEWACLDSRNDKISSRPLKAVWIIFLPCRQTEECNAFPCYGLSKEKSAALAM